MSISFKSFSRLFIVVAGLSFSRTALPINTPQDIQLLKLKQALEEAGILVSNNGYIEITKQNRSLAEILASGINTTFELTKTLALLAFIADLFITINGGPSVSMSLLINFYRKVGSLNILEHYLPLCTNFKNISRCY